MNPISAILAFLFAAAATVGVATAHNPLFGLLILPAIYVAMALKLMNQWERAVISRLGRFQKSAGPGLFWIIPFIDEIAVMIDQRIQTTGIRAEQALTRDTVPVT